MGENKFEESLKETERWAEKYEERLPHVADRIYALVKCLRVYDKTVEESINAVTESNRLIKVYKKTIKYMFKFLKKSEQKQVIAYMEGLADGKVNPT